MSHNPAGKKAEMNFIVVMIVLALIILLVMLIFPTMLGRNSSKLYDTACKFVPFTDFCKDYEEKKLRDDLTKDENTIWIFDQFNLALRDDEKITRYQFTSDEIKGILSNTECLQKLYGSDGKEVLYLFKSTVSGKTIYIVIPDKSPSAFAVLTFTLPKDDGNRYSYLDAYKKAGSLAYGLSTLMSGSDLASPNRIEATRSEYKLANCNQNCDIHFDMQNSIIKKRPSCPT